ncbi:hypothetical protein ACFQZW_11485 [Lutibacter aestuarii]|jgi:hypothetical protein|uniref:Uncharacterized protein n=2 Tax=Flavobacteriaceae TaxID=49546 RepID=A0A265UWP1_9FLAO|nr:hypothetical protein [Winogradskyella aurantia]OZV69725.1 hypothetical protein CA834_03630 [Winogradskyella aurantia]
MNRHKYAEDISNLDCDCPPSENYVEEEKVAYRWVHSDIEHPYNFIPVLKIDPNRIDDFDDCDDKCKGYGLSLFNDLKKAENRLTSFLKRKPLLAKTLGNAIAEGTIEKNEGIASESDKRGHFTFHEDESCDLKPKFTIVKQLNS